MSRPLLRFPLDSAAQARITGSITVEDGPSTFPDSLRLVCTVDVAGGAPEVRPMLPGKLYFLPDMSQSGDSPTVPADATGFDAATWIASNYSSWRTVGTLVVDATGSAVQSLLDELGLPSVLSQGQQVFNRTWYWPVRITQRFLTDSLISATGLKREQVHPGGSGSPVTTSDPLWPAHAVTAFLTGRYGAEVRADDTDPRQDEAVTKAMPTVEMDTSSGYVELWVAVGVSRDPTDDGEDAALEAVAAGLVELNRARALEPLNPRATLLEPLHPRNGILPARWVLDQARWQLIGADPTDALAVAALDQADHGYRVLQLTVPGSSDAVYFSGLLVTHKLELEQSGTGTVLQERRVPAHGLVFVPVSEAAPPTVVLSFTEGALRVTETDGTLDTSTGADRVTVNLATLVATSPARVVLQPAAPDPTDAAAVAAWRNQLASLDFRLGQCEVTRRATKDLLSEYEQPLRPATGYDGIPVFRGSLNPWVQVSQSDLDAFFDGLRQITFAATSPLRVRPAEAMVMWIMEGKLEATSVEITNPDGSKSTFRFFRGSWLELPGIFGTISGFGFTQASLDAAGEADIRTLVRVLLCWRWWGMDIMNAHSGSATDNTPILSGDVATVMGQHRAQMNAHLAFITSQGVNPPTQAQIESTVNVRKNANGHWEFSKGANHIARYAWLQHAEYLSRLPGLHEAENTLPAFGYIAYNGGTGTSDDLWEEADGKMTDDPITFLGMTHEEVLRSWPMDADEQSRTPTGDTTVRSTAARVNGVQFSALVYSYGAVFPRVV